MTTTIVLPDLLSHFPAPDVLNPHHEEVAPESARWMEGFHILNPKAQGVFKTYKFELVASRVYPFLDRAHLRLASDMMHWYFAYDAVTDDMSGISVKELATTLINILRDPSTPLPVPSPMGEMTRSLWSRILAFSTPSASQRLRKSFPQYIEAIAVEAEEREHGIILSIEGYLALRRDTSATKCIMGFILLPYDISEEVMTHPSIQKLTEKTLDLTLIINDVLSFNFERRHGQDGHNLITAVMKEKSLHVQAALDYVDDWYRQTMESLLEDIKAVPSFSPSIDKIIQYYITGICATLKGQWDWSFESERYFGKEGPRVKQTRVVELYGPNALVLRKDGTSMPMGTLQALQEGEA